MESTILRFVIASGLAASLNIASAQPQSAAGFQVASTTFSDGGTLPLSMVYNQCTSFPGGGDMSPQLSWTNAPRGTHSFIVVLYDVTASFTHWGMYNIAPTTSMLPENAGTAGSSYGTQISNDFGDLSYDGPCPPPLTPASHRYVITVYALDIMLPTLPMIGDFPPGAEALYHALIVVGGHILDIARISGFYPAQG